MSVWAIPEGLIEITQQYVNDNMPAGTTEVAVSYTHLRAHET